MLMAHRTMGSLYFMVGNFRASYTHKAKGLALYSLQLHPQQQTYDYNFHDAGAACYVYMVLSLWMLGYPDQALCKLQEALVVARERARPYRLAWVLFVAAHLHQYRGEAQSVYEHTEASISLAREQSFSYHLGHAVMVQGWR